MRRSALAAGVALCSLPAAAGAQHLMVADWTDRVMLFDAQTGALVNASFIPDEGPSASGGRYDLQSPREAIQVGDEIWVSDQAADRIFRFTAELTPQYLGAITEPLDNIRGMAATADRVYVCNAGTFNGANGNSIVVFDHDGAFVSWFPTSGSPHDAVIRNGELLVSNSDRHDLDRYSLSGVFLGVLLNNAASGTGVINFPQQVCAEANGTVLAAGLTRSRGIFQYDVSGRQTFYWPTTGSARGVAPLGNGKLLITQGFTGVGTGDGGTCVLDPATGAITIVAVGPDHQYISPLRLDAGCRADFDGSGSVNLVDLFAFLSAWFSQDPRADLTGDGLFLSEDVMAYVTAFFAGCD